MLGSPGGSCGCESDVALMYIKCRAGGTSVLQPFPHQSLILAAGPVGRGPPHYFHACTPQLKKKFTFIGLIHNVRELSHGERCHMKYLSPKAHFYV